MRWYMHFHNAVISYGFVMTHEDNYVYIKRSNYKFLILSLYVDNILIVASDIKYVKEIKEWVSTTFEMKNMGEESYILGV